MNRSKELARLLGVNEDVDFEKPDNFVKLLKLFCMETENTTAGFNFETEDPVYELMDEAVEYLSRWQERLKEIQEQAQQIDWSY